MLVVTALSSWALEHTVQRGETLESIARLYNVSVQDLIKENRDCDRLFYVGMKLYIPEAPVQPATSTTSTPAVETIASQTAVGRTSSSPTNFPEASDFESERKSNVWEISYSASTFEDVKLSGSYGFSWKIFPWEIAPKFYAGIHFSPLNLNYGLNDFNYDEIRLGPAIAYYFTPKIFLSVPLDLICDVYFDSEDNTKTAWGMALTPSIYIGSKAGVFIGPQFSVGFSDGSKVTCGFRAGIYF